MDIGNKIFVIRKKRKLKQSDVASLIGINHVSYSKLEKKGNKISLDILLKIADAFEIHLTDLLGLDYIQVSVTETNRLIVENESLKSQLKDKTDLVNLYREKIQTIISDVTEA